MENLNKDQIVADLRTNVCEVKFTKVNGEERVMRCTLEASALPPQLPLEEGAMKTPRKENPDVMAVFDVEAQGWRSFRWDAITAFTAGV